MERRPPNRRRFLPTGGTMRKRLHTGKHRAFQRRSEPGAPPGTISVDPLAPKPAVRVMAYGPDDMIEQDLKDPEELRPLLEKWPVCWINVDGFGDVELLQRLGAALGIHPLALEDAVNLHQRPKLDQYDEGLFVVLRAPCVSDEVSTEQLSMFLAARFVVTFQATPGDWFDPLRERIRKKRGKVRTSGPDFLAYSLIDAVIDAYFPAVETYGDRIEELEQSLLDWVSTDMPARILRVRHDLLAFRRAVSPLRDTLSNLYGDDIDFISDESRVYLRDCYDHTLQLIDVIESYRDVATSLMEMYMSTMSNRTNDVVRVLTIITTLFMPLSFIAGIYGMNFHSERSPWNMPELDWFYGYPFAIALMLLTVGAFMVYFRRKGWLGGAGKELSGSNAP
jgi:magnesium transporter